ncbi:MAG: histidine kinase, partial [Solirubrobacterales bacterium]|nr:histidine kinase [Solirubrobacterales bacterium]
MRRRRLSLRARLTASAVVGAAIALAALITAFNVVLDARLRTDADNVLRERASTVLRGLGTVDGRLSVIEAPDLGAIDAQTWIFAGERVLEQPARVDSRNQRMVLQLARTGQGFRTVDVTDTRLLATPAREGTQRLGTVVVGASVSPYESTASAALLGSVILGLLMLAAIAALSLWLITHALRPVAEMTAQAADWGERDLSRRFFAGRPHDELTSLASVFDALLARLAGSLRREQRLTAEISHELRTPLAK